MVLSCSRTNDRGAERRKQPPARRGKIAVRLAVKSRERNVPDARSSESAGSGTVLLCDGIAADRIRCWIRRTPA
jgi:hypothetical protein